MMRYLLRLTKAASCVMLIVFILMTDIPVINLITFAQEQTTIWISRPTAESKVVDAGGVTYGYGPGSGGQGASTSRFYSIHDNESITSPIYYYTVPRIGPDGSPIGSNIPGYCIQPGKKNGSLTGMVNDFSGSTAWNRFTENQRLTASAILLYGYRFDMAGNSIFLNRPLAETGFTKESAYVATQILIWEVVEGMRVDLSGYNDGYVAPPSAPDTQTNQYWTSVIANKPAYGAYVDIISSMSNYFLRPSYSHKSYEDAKLNSKEVKYTGGKYILDLSDQATVDNTGLQIGDFSSISVSFDIDGVNNKTIYYDFGLSTFF